MSAVAVIIGIDDYEIDPLTTARRDALIFRDALLALNLVADTDVVLLTSPAGDGAGVADRRTINDTLMEVYDRGADLDRLYFFFAGHGLSAYTSASRSSASTFLIPREVVDLGADAFQLLNFDNLRMRLERAGPAEQYFFIDACRDLAFGNRPGDPPDSLGWRDSAQPRDEPTAQAVLYAVSVGGQALGVREGMGVMTSHLVDALHGRGVALDYSDDDDAWVVTSESIARHVQERVRETVRGHQQWTHQYMIPDLRSAGPPLRPLRVIEPPPRTTFRLDFYPLAAADWTRVRLKLRGQTLQEPCWPPRKPGEPIETLGPQVYWIDVETDRGSATADPVKIDLRKEQAAEIRFTDAAPTAVPALPLEPAPGDANVHTTGVSSAPPLLGTVRALADAPEAVIELVNQDPPYRRWDVSGAQLDVNVPPGNYAIHFRLGNEVYSRTEFDVAAGDTKDITPGGAQSPALAEAVGSVFGGGVVLSESLGPIRSSPLLTALPIVGVFPFDTSRELFNSFRSSLQSAVNPIDIDAFGGRPVRVVVAADGNGWPAPASDVAAGTRCSIVAGAAPPIDLPLTPLSPGTEGWARLAHGTLAAPANSFIVRFSSPVFGEIELAAAALPNRITVIGLALSPDGRLDAIQHLMRVPGRAYPAELEPMIPYSRSLRELVMGQRLYESNELISRGAVPSAQALRSLLSAKWTDPVLGCMAYYAWNDAVARDLPEAQHVAPSRTTAQNLMRYFPDLPDARVIAALAGLPNATTLGNALRPGELPVLARSLREAATGEPRTVELERWASAIAPQSAWTLVWRSQPASV